MHHQDVFALLVESLVVQEPLLPVVELDPAKRKKDATQVAFEQAAQRHLSHRLGEDE